MSFVINRKYINYLTLLINKNKKYFNEKYPINDITSEIIFLYMCNHN
jgi:hypothetical protein